MAFGDFIDDAAAQLGDTFVNGLNHRIDDEFQSHTSPPVYDPAKTQVTKPYPDAPAVSKGTAVNQQGALSAPWVKPAAIGVAVAVLALVAFKVLRK